MFLINKSDDAVVLTQIKYLLNNMQVVLSGKVRQSAIQTSKQNYKDT